MDDIQPTTAASFGSPVFQKAIDGADLCLDKPTGSLCIWKCKPSPTATKRDGA